MQLFSIQNEKQRTGAATDLSALHMLTSKLDGPLRTLLQSEILDIQQLLGHVARGYGCHDRVFVYGRMDRFLERRETPSPVQANEIYDLDEEFKRAVRDGFSLIGGLGGFSMENGARAAELILLPGGTAVRAYMEHGRYVAMMVPPTNIYPLAVFTGRKVSNYGQESFVALLQKGDSIKQPLEEIGKLVGNNQKTITGTLVGRFTGSSGYVFTRASPKTEWVEFQEETPRDFFIYQTLLAENIAGFTRTTHSHAYEKIKLGSRDSFGAHLYDTRAAEPAIGFFTVAKEVVTVHY